jgi:hypothetical protein
MHGDHRLTNYALLGKGPSISAWAWIDVWLWSHPKG